LTNTTGFPAANLAGTALPSAIVTSSLTALGTVATGVWNGTAIGIGYGGTGQTTASAGFNALSPITTTGDLIIGNGTNSATRLPIGLNTYVLTSNGTTATWAASGSGGSGTVNSGTQYQLGYYASTGTAISGNSNIKTDANSNLNLAATSATLNSANTFGFKNRIINGGMTIDQRNAGASVTPTATTYTLDRFNIVVTQSSKLSVQQLSASPPTGFTNYLGITSLSSYSVSSGDLFLIQQKIEGFNVADLAWGTANAKTITLSFQVYSSLTGTFGGALNNSAFNRSYPFTYSIPTANTWTSISITIVGDTSGTWLTNSSSGINVNLGLGGGATYSGTAGAWVAGEKDTVTGAVSVVGTNGATFYITGVQLEVGTQATSFDFRDYTRELQMCQRYYYGYVNGYGRMVGRGGYYSATQVEVAIFFPVTMRTKPTLVATSGTNYYGAYRGGGSNNLNSLTLSFEGSANSISVYNDSDAIGTIGYATQIATSNASASVAFNSEL
jgi:hypothetical protein